MKDEINIPVLKQEDFVAANKRRDDYALRRDLQAQEFNEAIVKREHAKDSTKSKCEKCGKEFSEIVTSSPVICPDCR